jgi:hypothetical protein
MEVVSSSRNCQIVGNLDELVKVILQATGSGPEATGP